MDQRAQLQAACVAPVDLVDLIEKGCIQLCPRSLDTLQSLQDLTSHRALPMRGTSQDVGTDFPGRLSQAAQKLGEGDERGSVRIVWSRSVWCQDEWNAVRWCVLRFEPETVVSQRVSGFGGLPADVGRDLVESVDVHRMVCLQILDEPLQSIDPRPTRSSHLQQTGDLCLTLAILLLTRLLFRLPPMQTQGAIDSREAGN